MDERGFAKASRLEVERLERIERARQALLGGKHPGGGVVLGPVDGVHAFVVAAAQNESTVSSS